MADSAKKKQAKGKSKADAKGKKGHGDAQDAAVVSVAAHPKAKAQVRRAKGWGGLLGFVIAAYLSIQASVPLDVVGERALLAGLLGYMVGWAVSVTVWRQIMMAELKAKAEQVKQRRAEAAAAQQVVNPKG